MNPMDFGSASNTSFSILERMIVVIAVVVAIVVVEVANMIAMVVVLVPAVFCFL